MEIREYPPNPPHPWSMLVMAESLRSIFTKDVEVRELFLYFSQEIT